MVKIDLKRREEIGRRRRAKSRAQIIEAARFLFTSRSIASVTIEDLTRRARAAKVTFYSHFRSLNDVLALVAAELAAAFENFADSNGLSIADPLDRIPAGCAAPIGEAPRDPNFGAAIACRVWTFPTNAGARDRLKANLGAAQRRRRLASFSAEVGFDLVFGIVLLAIPSASEARLSASDVSDVVQGILRALGVETEDAECALRRVKEPWAAARGAGSTRVTKLI
jgi:AcrR family transcriptional regulator